MPNKHTSKTATVCTSTTQPPTRWGMGLGGADGGSQQVSGSWPTLTLHSDRRWVGAAARVQGMGSIVSTAAVPKLDKAMAANFLKASQ